MIPTVTTITETSWLENAPQDSPAFSPTPTGYDFIASCAAGDNEPMRLLLLQGPRGEGKTTDGIYACVALAQRLEAEGKQRLLPIRVAVIRDTWTNLERTTLVSFEENANKGLPIQWINGKRECKIGRSLHFYFFGMDNRADCDKLQGFQCGLLWLEEVAPAAELAVGIPSETLAIGITSVRQPGVPKRVLVTFNPPDEDHWILAVEKTLEEAGKEDILVQKFVIPAGEKSEHFRAMSQLAAQHGDVRRALEFQEAAGEFDAYRSRNKLALEAIGRYDLIDRLVLGKVGGVALGESIVPMFSMDQHVSKMPLIAMPNIEIVRCWDGGLTPSTVWFQVLPNGGINILGSVTSVNTGMVDHIRDQVYCLTPEQRVLTDDLRWVPVGDIKPGDPLLGFDEKGPNRRFLSSVAIGCEPQKAEVFRIVLSDGSELRATGQHSWITMRHGQSRHVWARTETLRVGDVLPKFFEPWQRLDTYDAGWLAALFDGEGHIGWHGHPGPRLELAQKPGPVLDRALDLLTRYSIRHRVQSERPVHSVHIEAKREIARLLGMVNPVRLKASGSQWGALIGFSHPVVVAIEKLGDRDIVTMGTSTETYIAEGFGSHNTWQTAKRIFPKKETMEGSERNQSWGPGASGFYFRDIGDPALLQGNAIQKAELTASYVIENMLGAVFEPGPIPWSARREALTMNFNQLIGTRQSHMSRSKILIDRENNKMLIQALNGRARYATNPTTGRINPSIEAAKRESGIWLQALDALGYGLAVIAPAHEFMRPVGVGRSQSSKLPPPTSWVGL